MKNVFSLPPDEKESRMSEPGRPSPRPAIDVKTIRDIR